MARRGDPIDGVMLLDKPLGMSSNAALQTVRRLVNAQKAGHTGTLDPMLFCRVLFYIFINYFHQLLHLVSVLKLNFIHFFFHAFDLSFFGATTVIL